jgi:hypothetical protein
MQLWPAKHAEKPEKDKAFVTIRQFFSVSSTPVNRFGPAAPPLFTL